MNEDKEPKVSYFVIQSFQRDVLCHFDSTHSTLTESGSRCVWVYPDKPSSDVSCVLSI